MIYPPPEQVPPARDPKEAQDLREQLARDVEAFLSKGGQIKRIANGVVAFDDYKFNPSILPSKGNKND